MADKERRTVTLCEFTPESAGMGAGRGPRLWGFGYTTLANLFGMTEGAVRQAVHGGRLDPSDLEMVCESWLRHHPHKAVQLAHSIASPTGFDTSPEERAMIAELRERTLQGMPVVGTPEEEAQRMKDRCKSAPIPTGPVPSDLESVPAPDIRGAINAACAEGGDFIPEPDWPQVPF